MVNNVGEALSYVKWKKFDLIILEQDLNGGSELELCRSIRALDFMMNKSTPIIFYTFDPDNFSKQQAIDSGANACILKREIDTRLESVISKFINSVT